MDMGRCCATCAYFYPHKTMREWEDGAPAGDGECRRRPPLPMGKQFGEFPLVSCEDWCGEHVEGNYKDMGFE